MNPPETVTPQVESNVLLTIFTYTVLLHFI